LRVNSSCFDLRFHRYGRDVALNVLERNGNAGVLISK
jgi:hypothetical protein